VQLQQHLAEFEAADIALFCILNDPQATLAEFTAEHGITYPVLSDPGSEVIRRFGILNTLVRPDEPVYGIPFPGSYLTDAQGVVTAKIFHQRYQVRDTAESVLHRYFGADLDPARYPSAREASPGVRVDAVLATEEFTFQRRALLFVRLDLDDGLHVYGPPVPEGYFGTDVTVSGPEGLIVERAQLPPTRPLRVEELGETFNVFEGDVEIVVPLIANLRDVERIPFDVTVSYQACDDRQCFIPQRKTLHFDVPLSGMVRGKPRT
jgi:hypothetical protein